MNKFIQSPENASTDIADLVETIRQLSHEHQDRMLRIVMLLGDAPIPVQQSVQQMLKRMLENPPDSARDCIAEVDAMIDYLQTSGADSERSWDATFKAPAALLADIQRYN